MSIVLSSAQNQKDDIERMLDRERQNPPQCLNDTNNNELMGVLINMNYEYNSTFDNKNITGQIYSTRSTKTKQ